MSVHPSHNTIFFCIHPLPGSQSIWTRSSVLLLRRAVICLPDFWSARQSDLAVRPQLFFLSAQFGLGCLGSRFPRAACFSRLDFPRRRFHSRQELVPGLQLLRQVPDSFSCSCAVQDHALVSVPTVLPARFLFCDLLRVFLP
jgi:hypothetical protein